MKKSNINARVISVLLIILASAAFGCSIQMTEQGLVSSAEAKQKLIEGNKRFIEGAFASKDFGEIRRKELSTGQKPFAAILSCSDSRVPPEIIFDQALGDIFVVRVAGNVVDPVTLGSLEYAVEHLKTPLVVVLGHESCGAVKATVDGGEIPGSISAIVDIIKPSCEKAEAELTAGESMYEKCTNENIYSAMADIEKSAIMQHAMETGKLSVVGAKYRIESGEVAFS